MAGICCESETRVSQREVKFVAEESRRKRRRSEPERARFSGEYKKPVVVVEEDREREGPTRARYGVTSVCGRRRDMEDAVSIRPELCDGADFYGVFDGHGCSHVAVRCRERLHEMVKGEVESGVVEWKEAMERSFERMDQEVRDKQSASPTCRCELRAPHCEAVGSTAVVAVVTPERIVVSNCGDSRAVLSRKGVAIPVSSDHKPDRADELRRIEGLGGRVIEWEGARVLGVLAMSRAIGDSYLKPYVISEPEVRVVERTAEDEFLILGSDGLWDVVSNETACGVARMCLRDARDNHCSDASMLLTKLALARHSTDNVTVVVIDLTKHHHL